MLTLVALAFFAAEPRLVAYYPEWAVYDRKFHVADIPADRLTHVVYAFTKIEAGEVRTVDDYAARERFYPGDKEDKDFLRGNLRQLQKLKARHKHLKTLFAVGGWTLSSPFSDVAATDAGREKFARSAVAFLTRYGFDGVDLDWEYPVSGGLATNKTRKEDRANYTLLLATLRKHLDAQGKKDGKHYLLTIAAPAGPATRANLEFEALLRHLDWFHLMSYDFHGGWSTRTHFNAPLHPIKDDPVPQNKDLTVAAAVRAYKTAGVPSDKIVMGVPFVGRGWSGAKGGNGLFAKPVGPLPRGTWEPGVYDYKDLAKNYIPKLRRHWHAEAKVPWLHDPTTGLMISYDDAESLRHKAAFAREEKLGGVMIWEITADDTDSTLLKAIHQGLTPRP